MKADALYGLMAEFDNPHDLLAAVRRGYAEGYRRMEAFSPVHVPELSEALGHRPRFLPLLVLTGGVLGGLAGFMLQYWTSVIDLPLNIGGRPLNSWPAFLPVTFECAVLGAALAAVFGMLALNGLPRLHHPVFNAPRFSLASRNRFFFCIEADDPRFDHKHVARFLANLDPCEVMDVER